MQGFSLLCTLSVTSSCSWAGAPWPCYLTESRPALWVLPFPGKVTPHIRGVTLTVRFLTWHPRAPPESTQTSRVCVQNVGRLSVTERGVSWAFILCSLWTPQLSLENEAVFFHSITVPIGFPTPRGELCAGARVGGLPLAAAEAKTYTGRGPQEETWRYEVGYPSRSLGWECRGGDSLHVHREVPQATAQPSEGTGVHSSFSSSSPAWVTSQESHHQSVGVPPWGCISRTHWMSVLPQTMLPLHILRIIFVLLNLSMSVPQRYKYFFFLSNYF